MDNRQYAEELNTEAEYLRLISQNIYNMNEGFGDIARLALNGAGVNQLLARANKIHLELKDLMDLVAGRAKYISNEMEELKRGHSS